MWRFCSFAEVPTQEPFSRQYCSASFPVEGIGRSLHLLCTGGRSKKIKSFPMVRNNCKVTLAASASQESTVVMSNTEARHDAVAQRVSVLALILETPRRKSSKLCSMCCRLLDGESQYTGIPYGSGSEGAGPVTFHGVSRASGFSKSMQGAAAAFCLAFPRVQGSPNEHSPLMGSVSAFRLVLFL